MGTVHRMSDYERRSREPDAVQPRDPADTAVIVVLPTIRITRYDPDDPPPPEMQMLQ